jgi:hypothetical protein
LRFLLDSVCFYGRIRHSPGTWAREILGGAGGAWELEPA